MFYFRNGIRQYQLDGTLGGGIYQEPVMGFIYPSTSNWWYALITEESDFWQL